MLPLFRGHAAIAGGRGGADPACAAAQRFLGGSGQRTEAHPGNGDRNLQRDRLLGETCAQQDIGHASLPIPLERVA